MTNLEKAAITWWRMRRPVGWSLDKHLANPTINVGLRGESRLAKQVAKRVAASRRSRNTTQ